MAICSKWKKVRDNYLRIWKEIIDRYDLRIPQEKYYHIAEALGHAEGGGWGWGSILGIVVAIVSAVFTSGASLIGILNIAASVVSVVTIVYTHNIEEKIAKMQTAINAALSGAAMKKAQNEQDAKGDRLTQYIVYTDYEIYANGSIYQRNNAGSQSYSPSLDYDTSKGIYALEKYNETDEKTQNRGHFTSSGNKGYMQNMLGVDFPLEEGGLSNDAVADSLENNANQALKRIYAGFNELANKKFNYTNELKEIMDWVIEQQVYPFYYKIINNDFLDKLKNYQRAKRADFDYIYIKDFKPKDNLSEDAKKQAYKKALQANSRFKNAVDAKVKENIESTMWKIICQAMNLGTLNLPCSLWWNGIIKTSKTIIQTSEFIWKGFYPNAQKITIKSVKDWFNYALVIYGQGKYVYAGEYGENSYYETNYMDYEEFYNTIYNELYNQYKDEIADYEWEILQKDFYIQRSYLYTLDEKAKDHLESLELIFNTFAKAVDGDCYLCLQNSTFTYSDSEGEARELILTQTTFKSVKNITSSFYTAKDSHLLNSTEILSAIIFKDNNSIHNFYINEFLNDFGEITQTLISAKGFKWNSYLFWFINEDFYNDLVTKIYYDPRLDSFDFNSVDFDYFAG